MKWSLPVGLMIPRAVPTNTQPIATKVTDISHFREPDFQVMTPQQLFGDSSEK